MNTNPAQIAKIAPDSLFDGLLLIAARGIMFSIFLETGFVLYDALFGSIAIFDIASRFIVMYSMMFCVLFIKFATSMLIQWCDKMNAMDTRAPVDPKKYKEALDAYEKAKKEDEEYGTSAEKKKEMYIKPFYIIDDDMTKINTNQFDIVDEEKKIDATLKSHDTMNPAELKSVDMTPRNFNLVEFMDAAGQNLVDTEPTKLTENTTLEVVVEDKKAQ